MFFFLIPWTLTLLISLFLISMAVRKFIPNIHPLLKFLVIFGGAFVISILMLTMGLTIFNVHN